MKNQYILINYFLKSLHKFSFYILFFVFISFLNGCGEPAVRVIIVPAATGGGLGIIIFLAILGQTCDELFSRKQTITPEQKAQYEVIRQQHEAEIRLQAAMDLPTGINVNDNNYKDIGYTCSIAGNACVEFKEDPSIYKFHLYTKYGRDGKWTEEKLTNVSIQKLYYNDTERQYRVILNIGRFLGGPGNTDKFVAKWDVRNIEQQHQNQKLDENRIPQDVDPTGL